MLTTIHTDNTTSQKIMRIKLSHWPMLTDAADDAKEHHKVRFYVLNSFVWSFMKAHLFTTLGININCASIFIHWPIWQFANFADASHLHAFYIGHSISSKLLIISSSFNQNERGKVCLSQCMNHLQGLYIEELIDAQIFSSFFIHKQLCVCTPHMCRFFSPI